MEKNEGIERMLLIMKHYKMNQRQFAIKIGMSPQTLNTSIINNSKLSLSVIQDILMAFPEISIEWFVMGEGEMLRPEKTDEELKTLIPNPKHHETFNARLRRAIKVAGIDCRITIRDCHTGQPRQVMLSEVASSHMARRTFIGCLYEQGFSESDICSMSGHKEGSISIQRYRKVSDERKRKMIDAI